jgi:hypothetical protein
LDDQGVNHDQPHDQQGAEMALNQLRIYLPLLALSFAAPSLCRAGVITVNGTCQVGDCASPKGLPYGSSTGYQFSFNYTLPNTDTFKISGRYSASSSGGGTEIKFNVRVWYLGNLTQSPSENDTLSIDLLQIYGYPLNLDGTYSYSNDFHIGTYVAPSSTVQTDLYYAGQDVGTIGPFVGPGNFGGSASADLTGLTNPLSADYRYTFFIAAGSVTAATVAGTAGAEEDQSANSNAVEVIGSGGSLLKGDNYE